MSQASLPGLASELKIEIFKSMDSFSSVAILSSTSRTFHNIWKFNTKSICDAVLQRIIECPIEAKMLLDAQESNPRVTNVPDLDTSNEEHSSYQSVIKRTQRAFLNVEAKSLTFAEFDYYACTFSALGRRLSPTERTHFTKAFYRAGTMVQRSHQGIPEPLVASWDMLDFQRVREVLCFPTKWASRPLRKYLCINSLFKWRYTQERDTTSDYGDTLRRIQVLDQDFLSFAPSGYLSKPPGFPPGMLNCYFIAYEQLAKTTDSPRGAHLAEILPLLPEGALRRD